MSYIPVTEPEDAENLLRTLERAKKKIRSLESQVWNLRKTLDDQGGAEDARVISKTWETSTYTGRKRRSIWAYFKNTNEFRPGATVQELETWFEIAQWILHEVKPLYEKYTEEER